jgi:malonyl-CoA O-methyltransferase
MRFDRASGTYEHVTPVQADMAHRLAGLVPVDSPPARVLELGCGTGHLTRALLRRLPASTFVVTDLAPSMLSACAERLNELDRDRVELRELDARAPRLDESFDLLASSAVVQWFPDLASHLRACRALLRPGGRYALSGFCRGNFPELEALLSTPPWDFPEPPGHALSRAEELAKEAGFEVVLREDAAVELVYPSALEFLRAIALAGASRAPREGRPLTRALLRRLLDTYDARNAVAGGVKATWKPWFLLLRVPDAT